MFGRMQNRKEGVTMKRLLLAVLVVCLAGCGQQDAKDRVAMEEIAKRLAATCSKELSAGNYRQAKNIALVSCVFARELNCVKGQAPLTPTPDLAMRKIEPPEETKRSIVIMGGGAVSCAAIWKQVRETALQADHEVEGLDADTYGEFLKPILSKKDMAMLLEIRSRRGYWPKVEETLK